MKTLKYNLSSILLSIFELVVGILLMVDPLGFTTGIVITFGIALVVIGLISVINYFRASPELAAMGQNLFKGITAIIAGVFLVLKSEWLLTVFPILTIVYGVGILLAGISKLQWMANMIRLKKQRWFLPAIGALISIICAIVVLTDPFGTTAVLWVFTAVTLIAEAVFDIVIIILGNKDRHAPEMIEAEIDEEE